MISILFILFISGTYIAQFITFLDLFFDVNDSVGYTDLDSFAGKGICTLALAVVYCHLLGCLCIYISLNVELISNT